MSARTSLARMVSAPDEWNRRRLQLALAAAALIVAAVIAGVLWSVIELLSAGDVDRGPSAEQSVEDEQRSIAELSIEAAQPGPLASTDPGSLVVPQPSKLGQAQVGSGFPRTSEGALAQLIAIDQRALESASVVVAQDVIEAWAAPGGPTASTWSGVTAVQGFLESAGLPANGSPELRIQLEPAMGRVSGDGQATTACVDFVVYATITGRQPIRIAVADCQHMLWQDDRWVIAPGEEAAPMPSLWPGTQASYDAGYQWLEVQP